MAAGAALGVSHAAISQQLRVLEGHLNVTLLDRSGRALRLTPKGERLAHEIGGAFAQMHEAVAEVTDALDAPPLHISVTPTFAARWLMPRLAGFRAANPDIDLMIDPTADVVTLSPDGIDVAIRYGTGDWPDLDASLLWESSMVVVAAPSLVGDLACDDLEALAQFPWIEEFGNSESTSWLKQHGVAVTVRRFVERDIEAGRLRVLHEEENAGTGYYIVTRQGVQRAPLKAIISWLKREARTP